MEDYRAQFIDIYNKNVTRLVFLRLGLTDCILQITCGAYDILQRSNP